MIVIPTNICPTYDIINHIIKLLEKLEFHTKQCISCEWTESAYNVRWYNCTCNQPICKGCIGIWSGSFVTMQCQSCSDLKKNIYIYRKVEY